MSAEAFSKTDNLESWFESLADKALHQNNQSVCIWSKYKDDLEQTKEILTWLPKKLTHNVMIPVGTKALMRGKIVHTNEVLVNLGETWFAKRTACQAIEICNRRMTKCDETLEKLAKEKELLESKKSLPVKEEAFGSEERPEIIEYVTEEEDREWRRQHRIKEKEYRQKLAEIRKQEKKSIENEEDLWNYLDQLELQEKLEDELNRLDVDSNEGESSEEDSAVDENVQESDEWIGSKEEIKQSFSDNKNVSSENVDLYKQDVCNNKKPRRKVSFVPDIENSSDTEPLILEITHSSNDSILTPFNGEINSPADIYHAYIKTLNPPSILKNSVNINEKEEHESIRRNELNENGNKGIVLPDVIEKNVEMNNKQEIVSNYESSYREPTRKISKFKASRMRKS